MRIGLILLSVAVALLPCPATARDIFVDNVRGDDAANGTSPETSADGSGPVRTIGWALRLASGGDRLVLAKNDKPYHESITLLGHRHSGTARHPFVIDGNGAVLDGSTAIPREAWEHFEGAVFRFRPRRLGHQQLFLDGRPAPRVRADGSPGKPPALKPGQWCLWQGQILFRVAQDKLPDDYALRFAPSDVGITLAHVRHVAIGDLTVQGFRLDGINAANNAREIGLLRVVLRGNGRSGLAVGGASVVHLTDSLLGDNGQAQLLTLPWSETIVTGVELLTGSAPACRKHGGRVWIDGQEFEAEKKTSVPGEADRR